MAVHFASLANIVKLHAYGLRVGRREAVPLRQKPSQFNLALDVIWEGRSLRCIYNVLTKDLVVFQVGLDVPNWLEHWLIEGTGARQLEKCGLPVQVMSDLIKARLVLPEHIDELSIVRYMYNKGRYETASALVLTLLPTSNCNMACGYCYQSGVDLPSSSSSEMSESVIRAVTDFSKSRLGQGGTLAIDWYGGEPLLALDSIARLVDLLEPIKAEKQWKTQSGLVTNGSLVTADAIKLLKRLNLKEAQVTLDGLPSVHNARRPFKSGSPSFEDVTRGIRLLSSHGIYTRIRVNVDRTFIQQMQFSEIVSMLVERMPKDNCMFYLGKLRTFDKEHYICSPMERCDSHYLTTTEFVDARGAFEEACRAVGLTTYSVKLPSLNMPCGAVRANHFVIMPNGDVYKCWGEVGMAHLKCGNIQS